MFKWLLIFAGAYLFLHWLKKKNRVQSDLQNPVKTNTSMALAPEAMVQCQYCKVHLPSSDALEHDERFYCSADHAKVLDEDGWIGSASWHPSPNFDLRPDQVEPDLVVIHHISLPPGQFQSQTCSQYIIDFFQNTLDPTQHPYFAEIAEQKVSSHFLITRSGELVQFVSTKNKAWHAGVSSFLGREKCNDFSIGIELEGDGDCPFEESQYKTLTALVQALERSYPNLQFAGHSDVAPNRKTDPGIFFDWEKFQKETKIPLNNLPYGLSFR